MRGSFWVSDEVAFFSVDDTIIPKIGLITNVFDNGNKVTIVTYSGIVVVRPVTSIFLISKGNRGNVP